MRMGRVFLGLLIVGFWSLAGQAENLAFPEQELAKESVLPVFDFPNSVRTRNVPVAGKFELGVFAGSVADEAIFNQSQYGALATYHFDETHGVNLSFGVMASGLGSYALQLKDLKPTGLDLENTFGPKSYFLGDYQFTAFYGKLSILKNVVVNTHIYGLAGLGSVMYDGLTAMALNFGVGQRFYILKNLALRFDLKVVRFSGPNPVGPTGSQIASGNLEIGDYDTTNFLLTHITGGLVFLF